MKRKGCLIPLIAILIIIIVLIVIMVTVGTQNNTVSNKKDSPDSTSISKEYIKSLTEEQGKEIDTVLSKCGIENISSIEHDKLLDNAHKKDETGYRIMCDRADNVILYLDKKMKVYLLIYADNKLYSKGKVKYTLQDFTFSTKEASDYMISCQDKVKAILKSPKSADFPNITEWSFSKTKKKIIVQGYVDAENSFGAELRSEFQFTFDKKTNSIQSFIFDGQEQIKN